MLLTKMDQILVSDKLSTGQRVTVKNKKSGTVRYIGLVSFSLGTWCGIELDEADGENDGSVDNVRYFSCTKKHGHFCHVSDILIEPSLSETDFGISECTMFQDSELSTHPNIAKAEREKREAFSLIESSDDSKEDLDDSLGIMDLDVVMTKSAEEDNIKDMLTCYSFTVDSREDFYSLEHASDSTAEQGKLNVTQVISSPEEASLNLTQVISSPEEASLNLTQVISVDESHPKALGSRVILPFIPTLPDSKSGESHPKALGSRVILPFIPTLPDSKSGESPLHKTESSPKYASTPKHEVNYTFTLDEDYLNSEQSFSPVSHLDKTIVKNVPVKVKTVLPESVDPDHENILPHNTCIELPSDTAEKRIFSVACSVKELGHEELLHELNKTFENFTLNTTMSISKGSEETVEESQNELVKTQTLNTTYEKEDKLSELPKTKIVSKVNKHDVKEIRNTQKSKIAKLIDHSSSFIACNRKYRELDKKKVRKSMFLQSKNDNREIPDKNRRKTFGSKSSLSDDIALSQNQNLSPNFDQKQDGPSHGAILKTKVTLVKSPKKICDKSKQCLMKGGTGIESIKTKHKSIKSAVKISTLMPKPPSKPNEKYISTLEEEQKFSFNETLNLTKSAPDTETVFEKSKFPSKRLSASECQVSKNFTIVSSLVPRPCSSKIEESKSTAQKNKKKSVREIKQPIQSELDTETTFEKPKRHPKKFSAIKCGIPRAVFTEESSLPVPKNETAVKSIINTKKETIHYSGLQVKHVLSPKNRHDSSVSGPCNLQTHPKTTKRQSFGFKTSTSDTSYVTELAFPRKFQSKKKDTEEKSKLIPKDEKSTKKLR